MITVVWNQDTHIPSDTHIQSKFITQTQAFCTVTKYWVDKVNNPVSQPVILSI